MTAIRFETNKSIYLSNFKIKLSLYIQATDNGPSTPTTSTPTTSTPTTSTPTRSSHWKYEMRYLFTKAVRRVSHVLFVRGEQR